MIGNDVRTSKRVLPPPPYDPSLPDDPREVHAGQTNGFDIRECGARNSILSRYFSTLREEIDIKERPAGRDDRNEKGGAVGAAGERDAERWREIEIARARGAESGTRSEGSEKLEKERCNEGGVKAYVAREGAGWKEGRGRTCAGGKIERFTCTDSIIKISRYPLVIVRATQTFNPPHTSFRAPSRRAPTPGQAGLSLCRRHRPRTTTRAHFCAI